MMGAVKDRSLKSLRGTPCSQSLWITETFIMLCKQAVALQPTKLKFTISQEPLDQY